jgi:two-component system sensor histidine kinase/response regulator
MATDGMNGDAPTGVDVSSLQALRHLQRPGQPDVVGRIVSRFLEETPQRLSALHAALEQHDPAALERAAHALKGIAGTVGANEMSELAHHLELRGRSGRTEGASALVQELDDSLARARPVFERFRSGE